MKINKNVALTLIAVVILISSLTGLYFRHKNNKYWVTEYSDSGGTYKCTKKINVKYVEGFTNSYKKEKYQEPVDPQESQKYCTLYAAY